MQQFGQLVVSALPFGAIYALAALGLVAILKTSDMVNFAFGALGTLTAYIFWTFWSVVGLPIWAAWIIALLCALIMGVVVDRLVTSHLRSAPVVVTIVATLGVFLVVEGTMGIIWGHSPKRIPPVISPREGDALRFFGFFLSGHDVFTLVLTAVLVGLLYWVYERTRVGIALRAVAQDRETASLMGISAERYISASWAVGGLLVGVAAILIAPAIALAPTQLNSVVLFAFAGAILGGFGSFVGALVGGLLVGIVANLVAGYLSPNLQLSIIFLLIVLVLYVRPQGIFGREVEVRA